MDEHTLRQSMRLILNAVDDLTEALLRLDPDDPQRYTQPPQLPESRPPWLQQMARWLHTMITHGERGDWAWQVDKTAYDAALNYLRPLAYPDDGNGNPAPRPVEIDPDALD